MDVNGSAECWISLRTDNVKQSFSVILDSSLFSPCCLFLSVLPSTLRAAGLPAAL